MSSCYEYTESALQGNLKLTRIGLQMIDIESFVIYSANFVSVVGIQQSWPPMLSMYKNQTYYSAMHNLGDYEL